VRIFWLDEDEVFFKKKQNCGDTDISIVHIFYVKSSLCRNSLLHKLKLILVYISEAINTCFCTHGLTKR